MPPFEGSKQRVERADAHRKTLAAEWSRFVEREPYSVRTEMNKDGTGRIWIMPNCPIPAELPLILGEMLYQFRAALDGAVYEAAIIERRQNPPPNEKYLQFPVCASMVEFENAARNIVSLSDNCKRFIQGIQPYNIPKLPPQLQVFNCNRSLELLNDWARKDRHRRLHVVGSLASNAAPLFRCPPGVTVAHIDIVDVAFLQDETQIASFQLLGYAPGMNVQTNPNLFIDIAINESPIQCYGNDTFANRLLHISATVRLIISGLEEIVLNQ